MEVLSWIEAHWLEIIQTLGVVGLFFTALSLRIDARVRRVANRLTITQHHRDLWIYFHSRPEFKRVMEAKVDLQQKPITSEEEHFVTLAILHFNGALMAITEDMYQSPDGLKLDVIQFFSLPIPKAVWERIKSLQDRDLVRFVESTSSPMS